MNMVFYCRGCGKQIHETAVACPECGAPQQPLASTAAAANVSNPGVSIETPSDSFNKKLHIAMVAAAGIGVVLIYTTLAFALIGAAAGACFVLSVRLYLAHQKNGFAGSSRVNWILVSGGAGLALLCMLAGSYNAQGLILIFVGVRSLLMYFSIYSQQAVAIPPAKTD